jgi:hypothetical protein
MHGSVTPYGVAIGDALRDGSSTTEDLIKLRDHARMLLTHQGDLSDALDKLEHEIARRGQA